MFKNNDMEIYNYIERFVKVINLRNDFSEMGNNNVLE